MDRTALQSALRQMHRHFTDRRVLGSMAAVAVILGFAGPFGTFDMLPLTTRLLYWAGIVLATYGVGYAVSEVVLSLLRPLLGNTAVRVIVLGLCSGLPITVAVLAINVGAFGTFGWRMIDALTLLLNCTVIAIGVNTIAEIAGSVARSGDEAESEAALPAVLLRIPLPQRGQLLALSVADHYVEVITDRGKTLVLMRLGDAIRETAPVKGLQIHRSHWVARDAVKRGVRSAGKAEIELVNGTRLPVSRGYLPAAKAVGLLK
ncbi:MAG: hypothetical protein JWR75_2108 [Devosia sp.]|nr:hypothetical protein [Devosia sp.]